VRQSNALPKISLILPPASFKLIVAVAPPLFCAASPQWSPIEPEGQPMKSLHAAACLWVVFALPAFAAAHDPPKRPPKDLDDQLRKLLDDPLGESSPAGGNHIADIAGDMTLVVGDLAKLATGKPTQDKQDQIVKKLDDLISQLEQECEACRAAGRSGRNPTRPLGDSVIVGGPGGIGNLHAPKPEGKKWAELPPKERERILQSQTEGFPPHYQRILERYYRRVAEERPATETDKPKP
jgi:hypothetical protein